MASLMILTWMRSERLAYKQDMSSPLITTAQCIHGKIHVNIVLFFVLPICYPLNILGK